MKALSLSRPLFIFIIGLPGAGKSFFARQFAETFNAPLVSADRVRFELFDTPTFNANEQGLIKRLLDAQLTELTKTKHTIVIDGICNSRTERQALEHVAAAHGYGSVVVWVQTDEPTAKTRATQRSSKRPGDEYNISLTSTSYALLAKAFTPPSRNEDYVVISGKHTYSTQAKMVLRKLSAPRVEQADEAYKETTHSRGTPVAPRPQQTPSAGRRNVIIR